jgi:hypothetical protein
MRDKRLVLFPYGGVEGVLITENDGLAKWIARLITNSDSPPVEVYIFTKSTELFIAHIKQMGVHALHCITQIDDNNQFKATSYIFGVDDAGLPFSK